MVYSGMLRRVALVRTDVSEEPGASFIRVIRIGEPTYAAKKYHVGFLCPNVSLLETAYCSLKYVMQKQTNSVALSPQANYTD
jgi:hypothetical protein